MAQQPKKEGPVLHEGTGRDSKGPAGTGGSESVDASVQQIWDLVRKSTDVIVALREENAILRNELSALRKSEGQLQDQIQGFLDRIETLERQQESAPPRGMAPNDGAIDRLEDSLKTKPPSNGDDSRTVTVTITINDNKPSPAKPSDDVDDAVRDVMDALTKAIKTRMTGS